MHRIRRQLERIRDAEPGSRFNEVHERSRARSFALRAALLVLGSLLILASAVTFWLPGPNWVLVFFGLAIVCGQSQRVARMLDRGELRLKRWHDERWAPYRHKRALIATVAVLALIAGALLSTYAWHHDWIDHSRVPGLD